MRNLFIMTALLAVNLTVAYSQSATAIKFSASSQYIDCGNNSSVQIGGTAITVEAWIKPTSFGANYWENTIVDKAFFSAGNNYGYGLRCGGAGVLSFFLGCDNWSWPEITSDGGALQLNIWQHVAATYDGANLKLYVNGKLVKSAAQTASFNSNTVSNLSIGNPAPGSVAALSRPFTGSIDQVEIWNTSCSESTIKRGMYRNTTAVSALRASYRMNDASGVTVTDYSLFNNNATLVNGPAWATSGYLEGAGRALDFDGVDDYIAFDISTNTQLTNNFTITAWIKTSLTAQRTFLTNQWLGFNSGMLLGLNSSGKLHIAMCQSTDVWTSRDPDIFLSDGIWHHVSVSFASGLLTTYVDGILVESYQTSISSICYNGYTPMNIGRDGGSGGEWWNGQIDNVCFWNYVLTPADIREYMMESVCENQTGLAAAYNLDAADGTAVYNIKNVTNGWLVNMDPAADWVNSTAFNKWLGGESNSWENPANWSRGSVPASTDNIGIYKMALANDIAVTSTPIVNNVFISSSAVPTLSSGLTVNGNLVLENDLLLNGQNIFLGNTAKLDEGNYRVYGTSGTIYTTRNLSNISSLNVAGLGAVITTAANLGMTTITRGHSPKTGAPGNSIARYYIISPTNNTGLNATLEFRFNHAELNSVAENNLALFKSSDGNKWNCMNGTLDAVANTITLSGISDFSYWTAADKNSLLPLTLLNWKAAPKNETVELQWNTAAETGINHFVVQYSRDGNNWINTGTVQALNQQDNHYLFTHSAPVKGNNFYRLLIYEKSGITKYSSVLNVIFKAGGQNMLAYPNPVNGGVLYIQLVSDGFIRLYNAAGTQVYGKFLQAGTNTIPTNRFPAGMYYLQSGQEKTTILLQ